MNVIELLRNSGVSPSIQRVKILDFLYKNPIHPSVDTIYKHLAEEIPTLSKTTVYNTLSLLKEKHLVNTINEENEVRYDAMMTLHGHFKCGKCQILYDFPISQISIGDDSITEFEVSEKHIYYKGICAKCKKKE